MASPSTKTPTYHDAARDERTGRARLRRLRSLWEGCIQMGDFKKSRRLPKKLLPRFPLSEEEPQRVPLQIPRAMRPGKFKGARAALTASSPSRPGAAAAPAGPQSCGVDAGPVSKSLQCRAGGAVS